MGKIKSIRQKSSNDNTFSAPIPFGADGVNIDMTSGLNLEEQFKLGGLENHQISNDGTTISSTYRNNNENDNIINTITYTITEDVSTGTTITAVLKDSTGNVIRTKQFTVAPPSSGATTIDSTWVTVNNETQQGGGQ